MAEQMRDVLGSTFGALRYEPTAKRIRVSFDGGQVADTRDARLVWEPRRVVPAYAVPLSDLCARLAPAGPAAHADVGSAPILDPSIPFAVHSCPGTSFDIRTDNGRRPQAAFRPDDPDLADYVSLDFDAFDWLEEDQPIVAHPHDPFHRIDILPSTRNVRLEFDGLLLAESSAPRLLFETLLPVRFYLPPTDIVIDLQPSDTVTYCAYKGRASYFSIPDGPADVAWSYHEPLHDAAPVRDLIAFFDERVDIIVDGQRRERPITPWSR
jgi:uncharacterized protein (DUF427 family)